MVKNRGSHEGAPGVQKLILIFAPGEPDSKILEILNLFFETIQLFPRPRAARRHANSYYTPTPSTKHTSPIITSVIYRETSAVTANPAFPRIQIHTT